MAVFTIEKPKFSNSQWAKYILARVLFPPVLLWDLLKLITNKLIGSLVGKTLLPSQELHNVACPDFSDTDELSYEKHKIITYDGAALDTLEIKNKAQQHLEPQYQKYIIGFVGNSGLYEYNVAMMQADAKELKTNVVGFNYRGVNYSTGSPTAKDDLVVDGIAQVQRLLDQGIKPENIILKSHSLGGGIASLVAQHFHQQNKLLTLFNGRSFSTITNTIVGRIRTKGTGTGHLETFGGKVLGWIAKPFIKLALLLSKWEINADGAFKSIPEAYRKCMVVRSRKTHRTVDPTIVDDLTIPHYASLYAALGVKNSSSKMEAQDRLNNAHNQPFDGLVNRNHHTGTTFFRSFAASAWGDHGVAESTTTLINKL